MYDATVQMNSDVLLASNLTEHEYRQLPAEVLPFLNPSRYCESDRLANFAFSEFGVLLAMSSFSDKVCVGISLI